MRIRRLYGVREAMILAILGPTSAATTPRVPSVDLPAGMTPSLTPRPPYTIRGRLSLISANLSQSGSICAGQGGYVDIQAGKPVTITDATGRVIGVAKLGTGHRARPDEATPDGACDFEFLVGGIPEVDVYGIELARRGTLQYSLAEMKRQDWFVRLRLQAP